MHLQQGYPLLDIGPPPPPQGHDGKDTKNDILVT